MCLYIRVFVFVLLQGLCLSLEIFCLGWIMFVIVFVWCCVCGLLLLVVYCSLSFCCVIIALYGYSCGFAFEIGRLIVLIGLVY